MPRINVGYWENIAHAVLGIQGDQVIPEVSDQLVTTLVLGSDRPEWSYAGRERLCGTHNTQPAVIGNFGAIGVRNPADSGTVAVVELLIPQGQTANRLCDLRVRPRRVVQTYSVTSTLPGVMRDTRWEDDKVQQGTCSVFTASGAGVQGFLLAKFTSPGQTNVNGHPFLQGRAGAAIAVLGPGSDLLMWNTVVNELIEATFWWREVELHKGLRA